MCKILTCCCCTFNSFYFLNTDYVIKIPKRGTTWLAPLRVTSYGYKTKNAFSVVIRFREERHGQYLLRFFKYHRWLSPPAWLCFNGTAVKRKYITSESHWVCSLEYRLSYLTWNLLKMRVSLGINKELIQQSNVNRDSKSMNWMWSRQAHF